MVTNPRKLQANGKYQLSFFFFFFLQYSWFTMLFGFCFTTRWISYTYIYPFFFRLFSHICYYKDLSRVTHAIRGSSLVVIYCIYSSMYMSIPNSQFIPSPCSLLATIIYFLNLWLYFCFVNKFISKNFPDFTYEWYHIFIFLLRVPWTARRSNQLS